MMRLLLLVAFIVMVIGCARALPPESEARFHPLPVATIVAMDRQRAFVAGLVERAVPGQRITRTDQDFLLLQDIAAKRLVPSGNIWELQALGVVFGDALTTAIPGLAWVEVTDEYGTDPTLRFRETSFQFNALTSLSKRLEREEQVEVLRMVEWLRENVREKGGSQ